MNRKSGVLFSYLLMAVELLSALLFTPFLIKALGQSQYGVYSLIVSVTAYAMLLDAGAGNAIVRYISKFKLLNDTDSQRGLLAICLLFYSAVVLLLIPLGYFLISQFPVLFGGGLSSDEITLAQNLLLFTLIEAGVRLFSMAYSKILIGYELFAASKIIDTARILIRIVFAVVALVNGFGSLGVVISSLIATVISSVFTVAYSTFKLKLFPAISVAKLSFVEEIFKYSASVFVLMIATQIIQSSDQLIIGAFVNDAAPILAVYAIGAIVNQYFQQLAGTVNGILMPGVVRLVEREHKRDDLQQEMVRVGRLIFVMLGLVWVVFLSYGENFISLWAGDNYHDAYYVALILMLPWEFALIQSIGSSILYVLNRHKIQAVLKIAVAISNIALTILLVFWNPLIGAALGTAISVFFGDIVAMNIVFNHVFKFSPLNYYKGLFKGILPCLIVCGLFGWLLNQIIPLNWLCFAFECLASTVMFLIVFFAVGASEGEKEIMSSIVSRLKK